MNNIYKCLCLLCLLSFALKLNAVPAKRLPVNLRLTDGTIVTARLFGDELVHFYQTTDGKALKQVAGTDVYEIVNRDSLCSIWSGRSAARQAIRNRRRQRLQSSFSISATIPENQKRGLVILVNFANNQLTYNNTTYNKFFNELGYSDHGMSGSVRDYFLSQSYGALDVQFDVVGPVSVSQNDSYYGQNDAYGMDKYPGEMVIEACKSVDEQIDFSAYDWNGDGEVEQVFLIYAGYGEAQNAPANTIWPHEYTLDEAKIYGDGTGSMILDGVKVNTYACSCELMGNQGNDIDPIGTACHEFSHCLNLPDTYDPNYYSYGMDHWDLMDAGAYNNNGRTPASFTSWERMFCGWLTPVELRSACNVNDMQPITSGPEAYIIYNQQNRNEFYLIENRQNESWDAALKGHGMLVLHVDYDKNAWEQNEVNAIYNHQRMTIIPANNNYRGINVVTSQSEYNAIMAGNPYPGSTGNTELSDYSIPASTLFNPNSDGRKYMNAPITDISELDGYVSFSFGGVYIYVPSPKANCATDVCSDGFTANWSTVQDAVAYEIVLIGKDTTEVDSIDIEPEGFCENVQRVSSQTLYCTTDSFYVFTGLDASLLYSYQVRALTDEAISEWSNVVDVPLKGQETYLPVSSCNAACSEILYDIHGRQIRSLHPSPGLYIRNGKKIRIK